MAAGRLEAGQGTHQNVFNVVARIFQGRGNASTYAKSQPENAQKNFRAAALKASELQDNIDITSGKIVVAFVFQTHGQETYG